MQCYARLYSNNEEEKLDESFSGYRAEGRERKEEEKECFY